MARHKRLGIDTGGTFTDFVLLDEVSGEIAAFKTASTPDDFTRGVLHGLEKHRVPLGELAYLIHGVTIGVNAIIEGQGARCGLLTTGGFEDVLHIGWMNKREMYNLFYRKPQPLIRRRDRIGVRERVSAAGEVLQPVDPDEVRQAVVLLVERGVESIAVCTLNSYANPRNEQIIASVVKAEFPKIHLSVSHEIANQRREFERLSTTVLNAYVAPRMVDYLERLEQELRARGFSGSFLAMRSNGGVMTGEQARRTPVYTLLSGPVGGATATRALGEAIGLDSAIGFDMGGTSTDISIVLRNSLQMVNDALVEGYPLMSPVVDIAYIGAGGGSLTRIVGGTSLRVGPESAGADPGPVCYLRGGTESTVTDANLVLGRLLPDFPLAEEIRLDLTAAEDAIRTRVAEPLGLSVAEAALGIIKIANVKMAYAIRGVTIERGLDPREFTLVAFGGAGPMHAAFIVAQLEIPQVVVPLAPGNFSAWGMLSTDIRHDFVKTVDYAGLDVDLATLKRAFETLEAQGWTAVRSEGLPDDRIAIARAVDVRYRGQEHPLTVAIGAGPLTQETVQRLIADFHAQHQRNYGHHSPSEPVEFVTIRVQAIGRLDRPVIREMEGLSATAEPVTVRDVIFEEGTFRTPVFYRISLRPGFKTQGPAIVLEEGCTTVLPPRFPLEVDRFGNMRILIPSVGSLVEEQERRVLSWQSETA